MKLFKQKTSVFDFFGKESSWFCFFVGPRLGEDSSMIFLCVVVALNKYRFPVRSLQEWERQEDPTRIWSDYGNWTFMEHLLSTNWPKQNPNQKKLQIISIKIEAPKTQY